MTFADYNLYSAWPFGPVSNTEGDSFSGMPGLSLTPAGHPAFPVARACAQAALPFLLKTRLKYSRFAPRVLPRFFTTTDCSDSRSAGRKLWISCHPVRPRLPWPHGHRHGSPGTLTTLSKRACPNHPGQCPQVHLFVSSSRAIGFHRFRQPDHWHLCNEAESGSSFRISGSLLRLQQGTTPSGPASLPSLEFQVSRPPCFACLVTRARQGVATCRTNNLHVQNLSSE